MNLESHLTGFLVFHENMDFCDDCLAARLDIPADQVRVIASKLAKSAVILRDRWICAQCGRRDHVTRALPNQTFALKRRAGSRSATTA